LRSYQQLCMQYQLIATKGTLRLYFSHCFWRQAGASSNKLPDALRDQARPQRQTLRLKFTR